MVSLYKAMFEVLNNLQLNLNKPFICSNWNKREDKNNLILEKVIKEVIDK